MSNAEIFRKAADYIREHGWARGASGGVDDPNMPACILGAIAATLGIERKHLWKPSHHPVYTLLGEQIQSPLCVGEWNDTHTELEVLALLDGLAFAEDLKAAATAGVDSPAESPLLQDNLHPQPSESSTPREESILPTLKEAVPVG